MVAATEPSLALQAGLSAAPRRDDRLGPSAVSPEARAAQRRCDHLRRTLRAAQQAAAATIFHQMNDDGLGMGYADSQTGVLVARARV
jgi:hypothetical protein